MLQFANNLTFQGVEGFYTGAGNNKASLTWKYNDKNDVVQDLVRGQNWHTPWNWDGKVVQKHSRRYTCQPVMDYNFRNRQPTAPAFKSNTGELKMRQSFGYKKYEKLNQTINFSQ